MNAAEKWAIVGWLYELSEGFTPADDDGRFQRIAAGRTEAVRLAEVGYELPEDVLIEGLRAALAIAAGHAGELARIAGEALDEADAAYTMATAPTRASAEVRARKVEGLRAEIERLRALDLTNATIALDLGISESYVYRVMRRGKT